MSPKITMPEPAFTAEPPQAGHRTYLDFYNGRRPHSSLDGHDTPIEPSETVAPSAW